MDICSLAAILERIGVYYTAERGVEFITTGATVDLQLLRNKRTVLVIDIFGYLYCQRLRLPFTFSDPTEHTTSRVKT